MTPALPSLLAFAVPALVGFIITLLVIVALRPIAIKVDLVDRPGGRKIHEGSVPVIGGLAMLLGLLVAFGVVPAGYQPDKTFVFACSLLVIVGLVDDRFDISPWLRLPVQAAAAALVVYGAGFSVNSLGDLFGIGLIALVSPWAELVTLVLIVGAINAFNMMDGMDGLAGATAVGGFGFMAFVSASDGLLGPLFVCMVGLGIVLAFLVFNVPTRCTHRFRCFMGDAGSTLLGFVLAWLCVAISQDARSTTSPVAVLWFVAMPVFELLWTVMRRAVRGTSPLRPDAGHFHHLLLRAGLSVRQALGIYFVACLLIGLTGFFLNHKLGVGQTASILLLIVSGVGVVAFMLRASFILSKIKRFFHSTFE